MFKRALLPSDGSEASMAAIPAALRALGADGEVVLLQVIPSREELLAATARAGTVSRNVRRSSELADHIFDTRRAAAEEALRTCAKAVEEQGGRVGEIVVESGEPGPAIRNAAERHDCDLIVMATNGRSGWRRAFLGSVAEHVVRHEERVPVMLVRRPPPTRA